MSLIYLCDKVKRSMSMEPKRQKELRAKARWSILRQALLPDATVASSSSSPHHDDVNDYHGDDGAGQDRQQRHHSMNAFPGFRVLHRTILPSSTGLLLPADISKKETSSSSIINIEEPQSDGLGDENYSHWDTVQYTYNHRASSHHEEIQFVTREATANNIKLRQRGILPTVKKSTLRDRIESLISHRNHNGVDNTGNVRVWDAEMTLAGFLLDVFMLSKSEDERGDEDGSNNFVGNQAMGLSHLRNQLRRIMLAVHTPSTKNNFDDTAGGGRQETMTTVREDKPAVRIQEACNILELGAGQAGLAGLAMMAASSTNFVAQYDSVPSRIKPFQVVLTDGHPRCIQNNRICVDMTMKMIMSKLNGRNTTTTPISLTATTSVGLTFEAKCNLLLWDSSSSGAMTCRDINNLLKNDISPLLSPLDNPSGDDVTRIAEGAVEDQGIYQLVLASDCIHFQEFHDGLLITIARTLAVDGIALLCQPKRGMSLGNFMALIDAVNNAEEINNDQAETLSIKLPLFEMTLYEDFHPKVSAMHKALIAEGTTNVTNNDGVTSSISSMQRLSKCYDPNWHLPYLLVLRKLRRYAENIDGELARRHVKISRKEFQ